MDNDLFVIYSSGFIRNNWHILSGFYGFEEYPTPITSPDELIRQAQAGIVLLMGCRLYIVDKLPEFKS